MILKKAILNNIATISTDFKFMEKSDELIINREKDTFQFLFALLRIRYSKPIKFMFDDFSLIVREARLANFDYFHIQQIT